MTTIKSSQLKELVSNIVTQLVKEYSLLDKSPSSMGSINNNTDIQDPNNTLAAAPMSMSDQNKLDRIKDTQNKNSLKSKQIELDTAKKKLDYTKKDEEQIRKAQIPNLQKSIQQLKTTNSRVPMGTGTPS